MSSPIEEEARRLRDLIYGKPSTDGNWDGCKEHWMKDVFWLRQNRPRK